MGLLDRIAEDALNEMVQRGELEEAERRAEMEARQSRIQVVSHKITVVANDLAVPITPLTKSDNTFPQFYRLDDLVLGVRPFSYMSDLPVPTDSRSERELRARLSTVLVALAPGERIVEIKVGMLLTLEYSSIARAVTTAPQDYVFNADLVSTYVGR